MGRVFHLTVYACPTDQEGSRHNLNVRMTRAFEVLFQNYHQRKFDIPETPKTSSHIRLQG
jgi:hypothetical protein